jgi:predicted GNAT superfamily acetyltransferase
MALRVRIAEPSDNEQLIRLARMCPMRGILTLYVDRAPDFFFLNRLQGDEWRVYVAEEEGELAGSLSVAYRYAFVHGMRSRIAYLSDVKIPQKYSGSTVAYRLLASMYEAERSQEFDYFICSVLEGNTTVAKLFDGRVGFPALSPLGIVKVVNIIPTHLLRKQAVVRRASQPDEEQIIPLLNRFHQAYLFSPVFTSASFRAMMQVSGLSLNDYHVVEENGVIVAVASSWDQGANKRLVVERHSAITRALVSASFVGSALGIMTRLPDSGQPLRVLQVRHVAFVEGKKGAAKSLLASLARQAGKNGYHIVQVSVPRGDHDLIPASISVSISLQIYCGSLRHDVKRLAGQMVYEDICLV